MKSMKHLLLLAFLFGCFLSVKAQVIPEFIDKPAFYDSKKKALVELEKSQYYTIVTNLQAGEYFFGSKDFLFAFSVKGS